MPYDPYKYNVKQNKILFTNKILYKYVNYQNVY